ncbi:MAG: hypothetical protein HY842_00550 [Bacteroidetes bacterium]|nr:hypothetical protein [Bacteroidota bacterium]
MRIADDRPLKALQAEFNAEFPFLEIAFFPPSNLRRNSSSANERFSDDLLVGQVRKVGNAGLLFLDGDLTPGALEKTIEDIFGLRAKIACRKVSTSHHCLPATSLREQNRRGMMMTEEVVIV